MNGHFGRPGLPADAIARLDLGFPALEQIPELNDFLVKIVGNEMHQDGQRLTAAQEKQLAKFLQNMSELLVGGQALTIGVAPADAKTVVYIVQQYDKPIDLPARMRSIAQQFTRVSMFMDKNVRSTADVQTYSDGGVRASRLRFMDNGMPHAYFDGVQNGSTVYLTACLGSDAHYAPDLANASERGALKNPFSAELDLGGALKLLEQLPDNPIASLSNESQKQLHEAIDGKQIRITGVTKGTESFFSLRLPSQLVQEIVKQIPGVADAGDDK